MKLAGCIMYDQQGRILLLHRNTPKRTQWEIPGGKIEPGESAEQAAVREIKEELGVDVVIMRALGSNECTEDKRTFHCTCFEAKILSGKPRIMEPLTFDDLRYFSFVELKAIPEDLSPNTQNFLIKLSGSRTPF